jgi:hypothetical protein
MSSPLYTNMWLLQAVKMLQLRRYRIMVLCLFFLRLQMLFIKASIEVAGFVFFFQDIRQLLNRPWLPH